LLQNKSFQYFIRRFIYNNLFSIPL